MPFGEQDAEGAKPSGGRVRWAGWAKRYGERHRWARLTAFPPGLDPPRKVRVYRRADHYLLNWWDPAAGRNLSERVNGDLLAALSRARQIDERVTTFKTAGAGRDTRVGHAELVERFLADLGRRADAGEVAVKTVGRYASALAHYLAFAAEPAMARKFPRAVSVNREFRLAFAASLTERPARGRRAGGHAFVLDAVRALYEWAADPDRGGVLPDGFRNPFRRTAGARPVLKGDPLAAPAVTMEMAIELVMAADSFELRLFVSVVLYGLRAAEPCWLFAEHLRDGWLRLPCIPELDLVTKGRRDKSLPLLDELGPFWDFVAGGRAEGLLLERRKVVRGSEAAPLRGRPIADLVAEYRRRLGAARRVSAADRLRVRDGVLRDAGAIAYDHVEGEFRALAKRLGWAARPTVKDLRHLFATAMNDAGLPDAYRRYLMGHSPGKSAVVAYTHLAALRDVYAAAVRRQWGPLVAAIVGRVEELKAVGLCR